MLMIIPVQSGGWLTSLIGIYIVYIGFPVIFVISFTNAVRTYFARRARRREEAERAKRDKERERSNQLFENQMAAMREEIRQHRLHVDESNRKIQCHDILYYLKENRLYGEHKGLCNELQLICDISDYDERNRSLEEFLQRLKEKYPSVLQDQT